MEHAMQRFPALSGIPPGSATITLATGGRMEVSGEDVIVMLGDALRRSCAS